MDRVITSPLASPDGSAGPAGQGWLPSFPVQWGIEYADSLLEHLPGSSSALRELFGEAEVAPCASPPSCGEAAIKSGLRVYHGARGGVVTPW